MVVISIIGFTGWLVSTSIQEKYSIKQEIKDAIILYAERHEQMDARREAQHDAIEAKHIELLEKLSVLTERLKTNQNYVLQNIWTKQDHLLWCYEVEKRNPNFKCPPYEMLKQLGLIGTEEKQNLKSNGRVRPSVIDDDENEDGKKQKNN